MPEQGLTIFRNGGAVAVSNRFQGVQLPTERLDEGVGAGFARVTYKGSKWGFKYQGETKPILYPMPDGSVIPSPYLDIVILRASAHPSKAWYEGAYQEGNMGPPDCWSTNGIVPDQASPKRQAKQCQGCQHNVWGSKINRDTGQATRGKACMDMKRLAVVPVGDIENKGMSGPMMLSVPPSSLKRLGPYQGMLEANGVNYCQVWTRVTFLAGQAYPVFDFDAKAALNDAQAEQVVGMLEHPLIDRILNLELEQVEAWDESAQEVHRTIKPQPTDDKPVAMTQTQPQAQPHDDLAIPPHLQRTPAPEPAPAGLPEEPPPGVDAAAWAAFLAMQKGQTPKKGRGRTPAQEGKRTPQVSPDPTDSAAVVAGQATTVATAPVADGPVPIVPSGEVLSKLMDTINKTI
jgi:hypothetical protein